MNEVHKKIIAVVAALIFLAVPILFLTLPKKEKSENENRMLAKIPEFSKETVFDGQLSDDIETYINDHFPFRDNLVSMKSNAQKCLGYKEINGVFLASDRVLQHIDEPNTDIIIDRVNRMAKNLADENVNVSLMIVPTNACIYADELPKYAQNVVDEDEMINKIYSGVTCNTIPVKEALEEEKHNGENLYYRLDHHWNFYGAYVGYRTFCESIKEDAIDLSTVKGNVVTDDFRGTLYSKALISTIESDEIIATKMPENITVEIVDKKETKDTYYDESFLDQKDKYSYFGGGNPGLLIIQNNEATNNKEIVVVKDSFANCLVPFLAYNYKKVHVIDPRYYLSPVSKYIKEQENVKDVLVLYNLDSLTEEKNNDENKKNSKMISLKNNGIVKIK